MSWQKSQTVYTIFFLFALAAHDLACCAQQSRDEKTNWYKGNLHTHSLWSDGNDFPEMIAKWYKDHGYHFLGISDHNILSKGVKWMPKSAIEKRGGKGGPQRYEKVFGENWVVKRTSKGTVDYLLKPLHEFRSLFEEPEKFLMIQSEEITDHFGSLPIHINATNLEDLIKPQGGQDVRETMANNLRAIKRQQERIGRPIFAHVNHPNFGWAITAEDMAAVKEEKFFEIYNGHPGVRQLGDPDHPSLEKMWDIANTLRIEKMKIDPLFGIATDDAHNYFGTTGASVGRGWVMVAANRLTASSIVNSLEAGNFYASSGVRIESFGFDSKNKKYWLKIQPQDGVEFKTEFIGTKKQTVSQSSQKIGITLYASQDLSPSYQFKDDDLYVRVRVTSSQSHPNPSIKRQRQQAWLQPIWLK
ncbi:MAG: hypothetical protein VX438_17105 [Planctomycetota bacterium]|nr:hypothetical protein [Planctomycetota bacterium]